MMPSSKQHKVCITGIYYLTKLYVSNIPFVILKKILVVIKLRNYIQERPTQIYGNCELYTVGGIKTNPVAPRKLKGNDVILQSNKKTS